MAETKHTPASCAIRWRELKERGNYTTADIDSIDNDTRWSEVEPQWWLEMMDERRRLVNAALVAAKAK